jgi:DNA helicase HerA-like ATPase
VPSGPVIGKVVAVSGAQVVATLDRASAGDTGEARVEKGHLVKIRLPRTLAFGLVSGLSIPLPGSEDETRLLELVLLGECARRPDGSVGPFRRGLSAYPALGDEVVAAGGDDLERLYGAARDRGLAIGRLYPTAEDRPVTVEIDPDALLGRHFAVIGSTGCGKSCAVAALLHELVAAQPEAHVLILDPHGEYGAAFAREAVLLGPETLHLPYWLLTGDELVEVVCGGHAEGPARQAAELLVDLVPKAKRLYRDPRGGDVVATIDTPVPYRLADLERVIDEAQGRLDKTESSAPYRWLRARLTALARDPRFAFMFGGIAVHDTMAKTLAALFRIPAAGRPVTILDLSGIPNEVLSVVVSLVLRLAFDLAYWSGGRLPILIVCEEAHRYAPADAGRGFLPTRVAMGRIAKEGRKHGVALGVVTQRPSDLEPSVLSQCNTVFAFRITSPQDQDLVQALLRDDANGLLDFLPSLGDGEAIVLGQAVPIPLRVRFPELPPERRPRGATPSFSAAWREQADPTALLDALVQAWRRR